MKKKMLGMIFVLLIGGSGCLFAQKGQETQRDHNPEVHVEKKMAQWNRELELTESQSEEMTRILKDLQKERMVIRVKYPALKEAKEEMKSLRKYKQEQLKVILTEEQLELMKEKRASNSKKGIGYSKEKNKEPHMSKMKAALNLSDDQVEKLLELDQEMKEKKEAIGNKYPELQQVKKEMKSLKKEMNSNVESVLSKEQYQKYLRIQKSHKGKEGK